jgi:hypothetical protein
VIATVALEDAARFELRRRVVDGHHLFCSLAGPVGWLRL